MGTYEEVLEHEKEIGRKYCEVTGNEVPHERGSFASHLRGS